MKHLTISFTTFIQSLNDTWHINALPLSDLYNQVLKLTERETEV